LLFEQHFNHDTTYGMLLSLHYAQERPAWVTGFLVVIKAEMSQLEYVDRSAQVFLWGRDDKAYQQAYKDVYAEDYETNSTIVLKYLNVTKFLPENDDAFDQMFDSSLQFLQTNFPRLFAFAESEIERNCQQKPTSYITKALSMFRG